ncbi:hypothetical protein [Nocardia testacea]|uniref:hypothetical protein n=1 Tax=Nocardia testacea TaxID=248551 RepID=UPI003A8ABEA4
MSRRNTSRDEIREQLRPKNGVVQTRITDLPHLAAAARRHGTTDRVLQVDAPEPQQVRTPNRRPGQWLGSGQRLRPVPPQYLSWSEIADQTDEHDLWEGGIGR